jgi:hypothetical protein
MTRGRIFFEMFGEKTLCPKTTHRDKVSIIIRGRRYAIEHKNTEMALHVVCIHDNMHVAALLLIFLYCGNICRQRL